MTGAPPLPPPAPRRGGIVLNGAGWLVGVVVVLVLVVVAIGYFTVISVFGVPWYAAVPLSMLAGAGIVAWEMTFSWKTMLIAGLMVAIAAASGLGWYFTEVA